MKWAELAKAEVGKVMAGAGKVMEKDTAGAGKVMEKDTAGGTGKRNRTGPMMPS